MFRSFRWSPVTMVVVAAVAAVAVGGSALTANITAPATNAGQSVDVVDGFTVTKVQYETDKATGTGGSADQPIVNQVRFTIVRENQTKDVIAASPKASAIQNASVWLQLRAGLTLSTWVECTDASQSDNEVLCDTTSLAVKIVDLSNISVVAYDLRDAT